MIDVVLIFFQIQTDQMITIIINIMKMIEMNQQQSLQQFATTIGLDKKRISQIFCIKNINYFDFNSNVSFIEIKNNYNVYHNVFSFINRLRMKIDIMNVAVLKKNLDFCLFGNTEQ